MVNIILCDDSSRMIERYESIINKCANRNRIIISLSVFTSGESLLFHLSEGLNQADIIYLDILMEKRNGIETGRKIREMGIESEIIFLTTSSDHVFEVFDISPMQYLLKHETDFEKFEKVFLRAVKLLESKITDLFVCESRGLIRVIPLKDISHFEIWRRIIVIHFRETETFEYYGTLEHLETQLQGTDFIRIHRSYLVHMSYIAGFRQNNLELKTGLALPIGRTYKKQTKQNFSQYLLKCSAFILAERRSE